MSSPFSLAERYFELRGPYLMYWPDAKSSAKGAKKGDVVRAPNGAVDLRHISSSRSSGVPATIELTSNGGREFVSYSSTTPRKSGSGLFLKKGPFSLLLLG